jgi:hypothetical protein
LQQEEENGGFLEERNALEDKIDDCDTHIKYKAYRIPSDSRYGHVHNIYHTLYRIIGDT